MEFKVKQTKEEALDQIIEKRYYEKYLIKKKEICLIGVKIDPEKRNIGEYIACRVDVSNTGKVTFGERSTNPYNISDGQN